MAPTASKSLFWWIELIDFLVETKSAMYLQCQNSNVALKPKNHQTVDDYKFKDKKNQTFLFGLQEGNKTI